MRNLICFLGAFMLVVAAFAGNQAPAILDADVSPDAGPLANYEPIDDQWDLTFYSNASQTCADNQLLGVECAFDKFYITGGNNDYEPNQVYRLDLSGALIDSFPQWSSPDWGWRDLAFDGTYLYGSDDFVVDAFDEAGHPVPDMNINGPVNPCRALAYDPVLDHFWTQSFSGPLYEFTRAGGVVWSGSSGATAYGAAWDDGAPDGPWLWIYSQTGTPQTTFHQFDPVTHAPTGFIYQQPLMPGSTDQLAGGAFFTNERDPAFYELGGMTQGTPDDMLFCLEMYPTEAPPNVTIDLTYVSGSPVPPGGGPIVYNATVTNNETMPVTFDAWISVVIPSGAEFVLANRALTLAGGASITRQLTLNVPGGAPPGTYTMMGRTGDYPGMVWDDDSFTFTKSGAGDGKFDPIAWILSGWDEPWDVFSGALIPTEFAVLGNYPNPFNPTTTIHYSLPETAIVELSVYGINGRRVAELVNGWRQAGEHQAIFDVSGLPSGVYVGRLTAAGKTTSVKMILMK
jgi:hypothetical protein